MLSAEVRFLPDPQKFISIFWVCSSVAEQWRDVKVGFISLKIIHINFIV